MKVLLQAATAGATLWVIALWPTASVAEYKCDQPRSTIDRRACAKAAEGPDALRRFVARTQTIWGLYYWDYVRRNESGAIPVAPRIDAMPKIAAATGNPR